MQGLLLIPDERYSTEVARHSLLHRALLTGQRAGVHDWLILARDIVLSMAVYLPYVWRPRAKPEAIMRLHESLASRDFAYLLPILAVCGLLHWFLWAATIGTYLFAAALGGIYLFRSKHAM